jgi:transposase-like protein
MIYARYPLSLSNVEDLQHERGIDICHETVRFWWNHFGPFFRRRFLQEAGEGRKFQILALARRRDFREGEQ